MFGLLVALPFLLFLPLHLSVLASRASASAAAGEDLASGAIFPATGTAPGGWEALSPALLFLAVLLVVYLALRLSRYSGSPAVPSVAMSLLGIGMALQFRIGTMHLEALTHSLGQASIPLGVAAMLAVYFALRHGRIAKLEKIWPAFLVFSLIVIGTVLVLGRVRRGASFLEGGVNPVEIVKPALVVCIASLLAGHRKLLRRGILGLPLPPSNIIVTIGLLWAPPMLLLIAQGDLGMFALMNATLLVMLYAITSRSFYLLGGFGALFLLARLFIPMTSRGRIRLSAWLDPFSQATTLGWQSLHALVALYTGGLWGTGLGAGSPSTVPIVESDFVYVIVGEELGFSGCAALALLYIALVFSGMRVAARAKSAYASCIATGLTACLGLQTLLNIGGVVKAIPLTGIPLPLLSHGGSSMVATLVMVGLFMAISDEDPPPSIDGENVD